MWPMAFVQNAKSEQTLAATPTARHLTDPSAATIIDAEGEREHTLEPGETLLELSPFAVAFAAVPGR